MAEQNGKQGNGNGKKGLRGMIDPEVIKQKATEDWKPQGADKDRPYKSIFRVKPTKPRATARWACSATGSSLASGQDQPRGSRYNYTWGNGRASPSTWSSCSPGRACW